jgi:bifunctional enzyme CysN/CysC
VARLAFVVVGHVDHGKSTLIGRLLADTGALPDGRVEKVRQICEAQRKPFEYAFLLDALEAEQLQGVTIDITEVRFTWQGREYLIIDAPGHKEFMKNMITGAAHADAALLVVDAREGVQEQSYRHAYLLSFLGVRTVAVVVTKMDLVDYGREVFERIRAEYRRFLEDLEIRPVGFVPVSAVGGDNVTARTSRMPWYDGSPVLELLADLWVPDETGAGRLRLPVQDVYKFDERRIIAGRLEAGRIAVGDEIQVWPSAHRARVKSIERWPETTEPLLAADAKASVGITLDYQLFVQRGDVLADPAHPPRVSNFVAANVFWFGPAPLELNRTYRLKLATLERDVEVFSITRVLSPVTMEVDTDRAGIGQNEAGEIVVRSVRPFVFDVAADSPTTGRFVLLDGYDVVGGGIVLEAEELYRRPYRQGLPRSASISPARETVTAEDRAAAFGHRSHVVWLTGVPGAGKSTIARYLERELFNRHVKAFVLDGESLRFGLSADLAFTDVDRSEQARRAAEVARLFQLAGLVVIVALVSPFDADREYARALIGDERFTLVYLHAPSGVLRQRDPHGLYSRVGRDPALSVPGVTAPYEAPPSPSLEFDTSATPEELVGSQVLERLLKRIS